MAKNPSTQLAAALLVLCAPQLAAADDSFRCPTDRIVKLGDLLEDARARCGEPGKVTRRTEKRTITVHAENAVTGAPMLVERTIEVAVEEWFFDRGANRFTRLVRFEDGRLTKIESGNYGR